MPWPTKRNSQTEQTTTGLTRTGGMKLVIDDKIPFIKGEAERLGETVYLPGSAISAADVRDADALIVRTRTRCDRRLLEGSSVKFIATATIGYDHIDTDYLREAGIGWTNCPGCNAGSVAQYVECALLLLAQDGKITLSKETTLGIVGVGHVGSQVALMARRLGLRLLLCDPPRHETAALAESDELKISAKECSATLENICREADIVTFHTPLVRQGAHPTCHLADRNFFASLRPGAVVINSSRGEVVDTAALLEALHTGKLSAAVIDTWENEPDINRELLAKAYIATPHIAGYSADGKANGTRMALEAVARYFSINQTFDVRPPHIGADFRYYDADPGGHIPDSRLCLYDPRRDSDALKAAPERFEQLRGDYPLRRECWR